MKYVIIIITMCFSLNAGAEEVNKIINNDKINQILDINNSDNTNKEQLALNLYKERLNLLSYKERQLKVYENSLNGIKMQLEFLQTDMEDKQNQLNEREIILLKKELQLKEKERDLKQLEEKLSQIDNIQLIRNTTKPSVSSVTIENKKTDAENVVVRKVKRKLKDYSVNANSTIPTITTKETPTVIKKNNTLLPNMSGLGEMKKDIVGGLNMFNDNQEK